VTKLTPMSSVRFSTNRGGGVTVLFQTERKVEAVNFNAKARRGGGKRGVFEEV